MNPRRITHIVIHCQAGHGDIESVRKWWHTPKPNGLGWKSPGYHIWIDYDGALNDVAPFDAIVNGVGGHNSNTIHICYRGGVKRDNHRIAEDTRTEMQKAGILNAIYMALEYCILTNSKPIIQGHRDFPNVNKACPSFDAKKEYSWITQ
jgi:N-acetylmuramoyl-L-alanine amidase